MKKIVIVGEIFSDNLGDGVICEVVDKILKKEYNTILFDISSRKTYLKNDIKINNFKLYVFKLKLKELLKKAIIKILPNFKGFYMKKIIEGCKFNFDKIINENPDFILFAGGQMFQDCFIAQISYIVKESNKRNIPIIFNSCGIGKLSNIKVLSEILKTENVKYISVRDGYDVLKSQKIDIFETYDTAILSNNYYEKNISNKKVGIGVMYYEDYNLNKQIKFWNNVIKYLKENKYDWEMFSNGNYLDQIFIEYLIKINNLDMNLYVAERPSNPNELIKNITKYKSIISMRLHSLIISYSYSIPFIGICWDNKIKTFFNKINRKNCYFNFNETPKKLFENLDLKIDNNKKNEVIESINKNINNIKNILESIKE